MRVAAQDEGRVSPGVEHYRECFARFIADCTDPAWLLDRRRQAIEHFCEVGFPTRAIESWRYTNVSAIAKAGFGPASITGQPDSRAIRSHTRLPIDATRLIFLDGHLLDALSDAPEPGVRVEALARVRADERGSDWLAAHLSQLASIKADAFTALNTAFLDDGAVIEVEEGRSATRPVHLLFLSSLPDVVNHPRVLIAAEPKSALAVICEFASLADGSGLTNTVFELTLAREARADLVIVQHEDDARFHVSNLQARLERAAQLHSHTLSLGGRLIRNELDATLVGEGARADLRGLFVGSGRRHVDNHTLVDHAVPHCSSDELYKGVLQGRARGVFRGRVVVRSDAQKSDARQSNPNLLLSDLAEIDTKPQLEIHADDVRCSHGSSIGRLDEQALFYLCSRGVGRGEARALLTRGFAGEITSGLPLRGLAEWAECLVEASLGATLAGTHGGDA